MFVNVIYEQYCKVLPSIQVLKCLKNLHSLTPKASITNSISNGEQKIRVKMCL